MNLEAIDITSIRETAEGLKGFIVLEVHYNDTFSDNLYSANRQNEFVEDANK